MTFIYAFSAGPETSETGPVMCAKTTGCTETALQRLPLEAFCLFRAGIILPLVGIPFKFPAYRTFCKWAAQLLSMVPAVAAKWMLTTGGLRRAMTNVARLGVPKAVLAGQDIYAVAPHHAG